MTNTVVLKQEPIEEDIEDEEEEVPAYPIVDNEEVANVPIKLEELVDWSGIEKQENDDGISY